ncbi:MAG: hypothetical protein OEO21_02995 [Candidatus Krumholzibacteria bacterium]|nr:hypothetical protein [Candidatus Krumholzibacteria bacterium]
MAIILPPHAERIDDLKSELILSVELQRGEGCDLPTIRALADRFVRAAYPLLEGALDSDANVRGDGAFADVENAYRDWKEVGEVLEKTLRMAYVGTVPPKNLLLDEVLGELRARVGDPISACYTTLRGRWLERVSERPWDAYMGHGPAHLDAERLESAVAAIVRGDELDIEDALAEVTGDLRHAFAEFVQTHPESVQEMELGLWKRPEILIAADYWGRGRRARLIDVLKPRGSTRFAQAVESLEHFFSPTVRGAAAVARDLQKVQDVYRERVTRCLMLHPDHEVRRYAASNADLSSLWKVATPTSVPCATILSLLEHLVGSSTYTGAQVKIFFDTVYRRLLSVSTRSDVLYARGIARILAKLDFFLEDAYFAKLIRLLDYLEHKERIYRIDDGLVAGYAARLRGEKERVGSLPTEEPTFEGVPLVILRKLARDGHFWYLLSMHPIVKIARETVAHLASPDRALRVAENHRVNPEVLRAIGKQRGLFPRAAARLALLANPKTPPSVSMDYLPDLSRSDVEQLLRRPGLHPELRALLRARFQGR